MYLVTGVSGVGKTAIIHGFLAKHQDWKVIDANDLAVKYANKLIYPKTIEREGIRKLSLSQNVRIRSLILYELLNTHGSVEKLIVNTTAFVETPQLNLALFNLECKSHLELLQRIRAFIIIDSNADEIMRRRNGTTVQSADEISRIQGEIRLNSVLMNLYAGKAATEVQTILNYDGQLNHSIMTLEGRLI